MSGGPLLELKSLCLRFGNESPLFDNLNWQQPDPCWTALVGPSGVGKTSLLHLFAGLDRPTAGQVLVAGQELGSLNDQQLSLHRQRVVGTAFQHFHLQTERKALDNLLLPLFFSGEDLTAGRRRAEELAEKLGLSALLAAPVRQLSGGQRQRLALARSLMNAPRLLLADEPVANLDAESARRVTETLDAERARGLSLLLVTHDDSLLGGMDQVFRVQAGELHAA